MIKMKFCIVIVLILLMVTIVMQNKLFFMSGHSLKIDLYLVKYVTSLITPVIMLLLSFLAGLFVSFFSLLSYKLEFGKIIKELRYKESKLIELVSTLREEIEKKSILDK